MRSGAWGVQVACGARPSHSLPACELGHPHQRRRGAGLPPQVPQAAPHRSHSHLCPVAPACSIYWDQASVLVQLGLLQPGPGMPVTGAEQADAVLDMARNVADA